MGGAVLLPRLNHIIMKPFQHVASVPSKHHKKICLAFNHWLRAPADKMEAVGDILQTFHTATLLIDDIQDDSAFRYGVTAAHRLFGVASTLNAASMAMGISFHKTLELDHPAAVRIFLDGYMDAHRGQGIDLYWTKNFMCPSKEEHIDMLKQKAASFFILAVQLLQLFSESKEDYTKVATNIGIYYPILDDYYNLFKSEALMGLTENKNKQESTFCGDITECKFTLPIIHALQYPDVREEICDILRQKTSDLELKKFCIALLKKHGSDEYTKQVIWELEEEILSEIRRLGGNPRLTSLMNDLRIHK